MKKTKINLLLTSLGALSLYFIYQFCRTKTDGFECIKITSSLPYSPRWEIPSNPKDLENLQILCAQPFTYLDSGGQSYVFLSQDKKVVIKFFKMHHLRQFSWLYRKPSPPALEMLKLHFLSEQKQKFERLFSSCKIAYSDLKEETGLIFLSLNPNPALDNLFIQIIDKIGISHQLCLSQIPFAMQYRAEPAFQSLRSQFKTHNLEGAKNTIRNMLCFLEKRYEKGVEDLDPALKRNIGLMGDQAIAIDIGSFIYPLSPLSPEQKARRLTQDTYRLRKWLAKRSKLLSIYFDSLIEEYFLKQGLQKKEIGQ